MHPPVRLDVAAILREKARGLRDVADLFDRAADVDGDDRGVLLDAATDRLSDVMALSRAAALETIELVVNDELAGEPWQVRVGTAMSMIARGFDLDVSHYRWASAGQGQTRLVFFIRRSKSAK